MDPLTQPTALTPFLQYLQMAGIFIGGAMMSYVSARQKKNGDKTKAIEEEIKGPGSEPSLRDLLKTNASDLKEHRGEVKRGFEDLHADMDGVQNRLKGLETAVYQGIENRLSKVEGVLLQPHINIKGARGARGARGLRGAKG